jgi:hypothetical protein
MLDMLEDANDESDPWTGGLHPFWLESITTQQNVPYSSLRLNVFLKPLHWFHGYMSYKL